MKKLSSIVILTFLVSAVIGFSVDPGNKYDYGRNGARFNSSHSSRNTPGHKYDYGHKPFKK